MSKLLLQGVHDFSWIGAGSQQIFDGTLCLTGQSSLYPGDILELAEVVGGDRAATPQGPSELW